MLQSLKSSKLCSLASKLWNPNEPLRSVDSFLRSKFLYTDENIETLLTPEYMIIGLEKNGIIRGDCDDISILHAALLTCMDVRVRFVAIRSTKEDPLYDHVFIEAFNGNEWILFDVTVSLGTTIKFYSKVTVDI